MLQGYREAWCTDVLVKTREEVIKDAASLKQPKIEVSLQIRNR